MDMWKTHMETLMKKAKILETKEVIEQTIWQYYFERGLPVPRWKMDRNPQWWIDYLNELGEQQ